MGIGASLASGGLVMAAHCLSNPAGSRASLCRGARDAARPSFGRLFVSRINDGESTGATTSRQIVLAISLCTLFGVLIPSTASTRLARPPCHRRSPGHRANILAGSYSETGVVLAPDAAGRLIFVQTFGAPE